MDWSVSLTQAAFRFPNAHAGLAAKFGVRSAARRYREEG